MRRGLGILWGCALTLAWLAGGAVEAQRKGGGTVRAQVTERERENGQRSLYMHLTTTEELAATAAAPIIDTTSTTSGATLTEEDLARLPTARNFSELHLGLPKSAARNASLGHAPEGWAFDASAWKLSGPPISEGYFRFDFGSGWKPPANVRCEGFLDGRSVFESKLPVTSAPPIRVDTDLSRWLDLPETIQLDTPILLSGERNKMGTPVDWGITALDPERVEVLRGGAGAVYGADAVAGTVNFILSSRQFDESLVGVPQGEGGTDAVDAALDRNFADNWGLLTSYRWSRPRLAVEGQDRFGETLVRGEWTPLVTPPCHHPPAQPQFDGVTEVVAPHETFCVCGQVSDVAQWLHLGLGTQSLGAPIAATSTAAVYLPPVKIEPGVHKVHYLPWGEEDSDTGLSSAYIGVQARIHKDTIRTGGSTKLTLAILGTDRVFPVTLDNKSPKIIDLEGGPHQTLPTSGGPENSIVRQIFGMQPGEYTIDYEVALPNCPCDAANQKVAESAGDEFVNFVDGYRAEFAGFLADPNAGLQETRVEPPALPSAELGSSDAQPTYGSDFVGGVEFEVARSVSLGVRYVHRTIPSVIDDLPCLPADGLTLRDDRFRVGIQWAGEPGTKSGACRSTTQPDSGLFYFFDPDNQEVLVKVLNGCSVNDRYWVFASGLTNVEYKLEVTDAGSGQTKSYSPPAGRPYQPIQDTQAFATCP